MKTITLQQLIDLGACRDQRDEFERRFGASVEITRELCLEHSYAFNWYWVVKHFLPESLQKDWNYADISGRALKFADLFNQSHLGVETVNNTGTV